MSEPGAAPPAVKSSGQRAGTDAEGNREGDSAQQHGREPFEDVQLRVVKPSTIDVEVKRALLKQEEARILAEIAALEAD